MKQERGTIILSNATSVSAFAVQPVLHTNIYVYIYIYIYIDIYIRENLNLNFAI